MDKFVPDTFTPIEKIKLGDFMLRKLSFKDAEVDYKAVMSSIDIINKTRSEDWPTKDLTLEENRIALARHQREFENRFSFVYCVWNSDETEYLGCIYFYPTNKPWIKVPAGKDVVVNMWVTRKAYDKGVYNKLFKVLKLWVDKDWPFKNPFYSNNEIPV